MNIPGDRRETKCRDCGAKILMIRSVAGKWIPTETLPSRVDGERTLVFANGQVGRSFADYDGGHESHFAHCSKASKGKRGEVKKGKKAVKPEKEEYWMAGCGCLSGGNQ